jgi:hypothetical protein
MKTACGYLAAGIWQPELASGVLSVFFAPKSGEETRKWAANKCFDAIDAANERVWQSRLHVRDIMNRGQQEISEAVAVGREMFGRQNSAASTAAQLWTAT